MRIVSLALIFLVVALTACTSEDINRDNARRSRPASSNSGTPQPAPALAQATPVPAQTTSSTPAVAAPVSDGVRRIPVAELRASLEKGEAVVVDVRSVEDYRAGHIKGAFSIPHGEIVQRAGGLPRNKLVVTYCS